MVTGAALLQAEQVSTRHVTEVLRQAGVLHDDRPPAFDTWLDRKLDGVASGIGHDVERWLRTLKDGGPRSGPRAIATVHSHLGKTLPALTDYKDRQVQEALVSGNGNAAAPPGQCHQGTPIFSCETGAEAHRSHSRTVPSPLALTGSRPSGENATPLTTSEWPSKTRGRLGWAEGRPHLPTRYRDGSRSASCCGPMDEGGHARGQPA